MPEFKQKSDTVTTLSKNVYDALSSHDAAVVGVLSQVPEYQAAKNKTASRIVDWVVKNILQKRENVVPEITVIGKHKDLYVYYNRSFPDCVSDYLVRAKITEHEFLTNPQINIHRLKTPVIRAYEVYHISDVNDVQLLDKTSGEASPFPPGLSGACQWYAENY